MAGKDSAAAESMYRSRQSVITNFSDNTSHVAGFKLGFEVAMAAYDSGDVAIALAQALSAAVVRGVSVHLFFLDERSFLDAHHEYSGWSCQTHSCPWIEKVPVR